MMQLGQFQFDEERLVLSDAFGAPIVLRSQSAKVLAQLAIRANEIVSRDELVRAVWMGRAITDDSIAQCIRDIRRALQDREHRIVQTHHKMGYRLNIASALQGATVRRPAVFVEKFALAGRSDRAQALALSIHEQLLIALAPRTGIRVLTEVGGQKSSDYLVGGRLVTDEAGTSLFVTLTTPRNSQLIHAERFNLGSPGGPTDATDTATMICHVLLVYIITNHGRRYLKTPDDQLAVQPLLMKAAHLYTQLTEAESEAAVAALAAALSLEPDNPMALAMMVSAQTQMMPHVMQEKTEAEIRNALALADRAVVLGPTIDFVFRTRANLRLWLCGDHESCRADCARALELNPIFHLTHLTLGTSEILSGQYGDGADRIADFARYMRTERQYPYYLSLVALANILSGHDREAINLARDAYERMPTSDWTLLVYLTALAEDAAAPEFAQARQRLECASSTAPAYSKLPFLISADIVRLNERLGAATAGGN